MNDENVDVEALARRVRDGARVFSRLDSATKDDALLKMAAALRRHQPSILEANTHDCAESERDPAFIDRLRLDPGRIEKMAAAIEEIVALEDPVGRVERMWRRPNGLRIGRQRIPLGVIGIIYEARPNVTSDAAALCLKSGNGVILRGGSDAHRSNAAVIAALRDGLSKASIPEAARAALGFVDTTDRDAVNELLRQEDYIDVIIPRGGKGLIRFVNANSRIPVIKHDEGVCHIVVEGSARPGIVDEIVLNAKTQRPTVCNALETLLVTRNAVEPHLERVLERLVDAGVHLYLCEESQHAAAAAGLDVGSWEPAEDEHWAAEFLSRELAVRVVDDVEHAVAHIDRWGSRHTEAILTEDYTLSNYFVDAVDSSCVVVNASTRFADGGQLGLGAEIGISTTRLHAYGPMGIDELTTTKFVVFGNGQVRE